MLWNCSHPSNKAITKELINQPDTTGKYLHRFSWLKDEEIGSLPHHLNWLAGWYKEPQDGSPKLYIILKAGLGLKIIVIVNIINTGKIIFV